MLFQQLECFGVDTSCNCGRLYTTTPTNLRGLLIQKVVPLVRLERTTHGLGIRSLLFLPLLKLKLHDLVLTTRSFYVIEESNRNYYRRNSELIQLTIQDSHSAVLSHVLRLS